MLPQVEEDARLGFGDTISMVATVLGPNVSQHPGNYTLILPQVEEGVRLARGDVVSMVVTFNPRTGERGGQRVRLLRQGDKDADKPEFVAERNPNAVRYVGNRAVRVQGF